MKCENFLLSLKISYFFVQSIDSPDICEGHLFSVDVDRKSVVQGKSVDLGGRRIIKKKTKQNTLSVFQKTDNQTCEFGCPDLINKCRLHCLKHFNHHKASKQKDQQASASFAKYAPPYPPQMTPRHFYTRHKLFSIPLLHTLND